MIGSLICNKQEIFIIRQLAHKDKARENSSSFLGQLWQILDPFIHMVILVTLFSTMFQNKEFVNYPIYVATGTMIYSLFNFGTTNCLGALVSNKTFLIKTQINKNVFIKERVYVAFINFLYTLIVYFALLVFFKIPFRLTMLVLVPNIILFMCFIYGVGEILAVINVYFADLTYFYDIFTLLLFYGSALFFDPSRLSPNVQFLLSINPIYLSIVIARLGIIDGVVASWTLWLKLIIYSVLFMIIGNHVLKKGAVDIVAKI